MIQIICTALTFIGAVALLGMNQWCAARHKQTDVLSGKLEELYTVLERIGALGTPRGDSEDSLDEVMKQMRSRAAEALKECKRAALLIALYFPELEARWQSIWAPAEAAFYEMLEFRMGTDLDYVWEKTLDTQHEIRGLLAHLTTEAAFLTRRTFS